MSFWNKNLISASEDYIGIDLTDLSVKVFQLERRGAHDRIRSFNDLALSPGLILDGVIKDKGQVAAIVKKAVREAGPKRISGKKVVCSVPESKVFLRKISIPKMSPGEAKEALKWEIEASVPLSLEQVYYDWQFLDESETNQSVLAVVVSKETSDSLTEMLEAAGLSVCGLEMESIATSRSLVPSDSKMDEIYFIVDIGGDRTSFTVTEGNVPYFTSSIPFSSMEITDVISKVTGSGREQAEKMKNEHGIGQPVEGDPIFSAVKPFLENLVVEIEKTIDFYKNNISTRSAKFKKIIVSGGGGNLKGLVPYLSERLSREVSLGDPWANLRLKGKLPPISRENSLRYATAVGLSMCPKLFK